MATTDLSICGLPGVPQTFLPKAEAGEVRNVEITFASKSPGVAFTPKSPGVAFTPKSPGVAFTSSTST